jgi:L-rhamnose mutarotase
MVITSGIPKKILIIYDPNISLESIKSELKQSGINNYSIMTSEEWEHRVMWTDCESIDGHELIHFQSLTNTGDFKKAEKEEEKKPVPTIQKKQQRREWRKSSKHMHGRL